MAIEKLAISITFITGMQYALMSYLGAKVMKYDTIGGHWCYVTPAYTQAYTHQLNN